MSDGRLFLFAYSLEMARAWRKMFGWSVRICFVSPEPDRPARLSEIPGVRQ